MKFEFIRCLRQHQIQFSLTSNKFLFDLNSVSLQLQERIKLPSCLLFIS